MRAVIGVGHLGRHHAGILAGMAGVNLVPVVDVYAARGAEVRNIEIAREEPLERELEDFVAAVRDRRPPAVTDEQGRAALALAERVIERMEITK